MKNNNIPPLHLACNKSEERLDFIYFKGDYAFATNGIIIAAAYLKDFIPDSIDIERLDGLAIQSKDWDRMYQLHGTLLRAKRGYFAYEYLDPFDGLLEVKIPVVKRSCKFIIEAIKKVLKADYQEVHVTSIDPEYISIMHRIIGKLDSINPGIEITTTNKDNALILTKPSSLSFGIVMPCATQESREGIVHWIGNALDI